MTAVNIKPLGDRILVQVMEKEAKTLGGILLPETAKEAPQWGVVIKVGPGKRLNNGDLAPMELKEGDKVIFGKYAGTKIKVDEHEYLFMKEEDVMGVQA